jgi:hypothetical protein
MLPTPGLGRAPVHWPNNDYPPSPHGPPRTVFGLRREKCEPPRLTVPLSDPIASPIPLLDSQQTGIQPQGGRPGATT